MKNPILEQHLYNIRNPETQRKEFRESLERIGECLGLEIARKLETEKRTIQTSLGKKAYHKLIGDQLVLIGILRAGIPLLYGLQRTFPYAETGFVGAMRNEKTLEAEISYIAIPDLKGKTTILADTMIATGGSIIDTIKQLKRYNPKEIIIAGVIASRKGLRKIKDYDRKIKVYTAATDPLLDENGYIVPGLGDAGDRSFGEKI